jgi:protein involved in polysaccharide export with SLBB domain
LVDEGNLLLNLPVGAGDVITVPPRAEQYIYVLGYVQRPGAYELGDGVRVDALRAIAMAQGLSAAARAENSVLIRETAEGQMVVSVDLTKIARNVRPPIYLEPGDTLIVGSSAVARLAEFVRPSVGAGVHYSSGQ